MRLAFDKCDRAAWAKYQVFLDGAPVGGGVKLCEADEERGKIVYFETEPDGAVRLVRRKGTPGVNRITLFGRVEIRAKADEAAVVPLTADWGEGIEAFLEWSEEEQKKMMRSFGVPQHLLHP